MMQPTIGSLFLGEVVELPSIVDSIGSIIWIPTKSGIVLVTWPAIPLQFSLHYERKRIWLFGDYNIHYRSGIPLLVYKDAKKSFK